MSTPREAPKSSIKGFVLGTGLVVLGIASQFGMLAQQAAHKSRSEQAVADCGDNNNDGVRDGTLIVNRAGVFCLKTDTSTKADK